MISAVSSWSGGKDSCFAFYKARQDGYRIEHLLNFVTKGDGRCCFHGIDAGLVRLQAMLIGVPVIQKEVSRDMKDYEHIFRQALAELTASGIRSMVFGDIYLLDNVNWIERLCKEAGVKPIEPLWDVPPLRIAEEFIESGFKALIISCRDGILGKDFIGRYIDKEILKEFEARKICPCGENGEFHTLVVDGPIFKQSIKILESEVILKDGFWKHWFLDIKKYGR
ncbi:MAG: diphthine--ammonia ligase [Candidatus Omnitrophota bacterium]